MRARKTELQQFVDEHQPYIRVCHFPPGTSEWNKIEHRLSFITENRRGKQPRTLEVNVAFIGQTGAGFGLRVKLTVDKRTYRTGHMGSPAETKRLSLHLHERHGVWNDEVLPHLSRFEDLHRTRYPASRPQ